MQRVSNSLNVMFSSRTHITLVPFHKQKLREGSPTPTELNHFYFYFNHNKQFKIDNFPINPV